MKKAPPPSHKGPRRKFDWDEARHLRAGGATLSELAERYGVSDSAIKHATDDRARTMAMQTSSAWMRMHGNPSNYDVCVCGNRKSKQAKRCSDCDDAQRVSTDKPVDEHGNLWCHTCRTYRPADTFAFSTRGTRRGFRHTQCRSCDTQRRQAYRELHKVPCVGCGKPALPASEKGTTGAAFPRCRTCYDLARKKNA